MRHWRDIRRHREIPKRECSISRRDDWSNILRGEIVSEYPDYMYYSKSSVFNNNLLSNDYINYIC